MRFVARVSVTTALAVGPLLLIAALAHARGLVDPKPHRNEVLPAVAAAPAYCAATHDVGQIALGITNFGISGKGGTFPAPKTTASPASRYPGCQYPKGTSIDHLFASALWVGAVVDGDTLVSIAADGWQYCREFNPNRAAPDHIIFRSLYGPDSANARSYEDFVSVYTDTFTTGVTGLCTDLIDGRPHRPLHIEVTDRSYAWTANEVAAVVFVELGIKNIGTQTLTDAYIGLNVDADVGSTVGQPWADDVTSLMDFDRDSGVCGSAGDQLLIACISDNDGDLGTTYPAPSVIGLTFLSVPGGAPKYSYHWWQSSTNAALDYGPRRQDLIRDFGTGGTGTPEGDRNKYFLMSSGEQDFAQIYTATIEPTDPVWEYPNQTVASAISQGIDTKFLLSVGPFTIEPSQELPLVYAWIIADSVHQVANNLQNLPNNPDAYFENLDFTAMARAVRAANRFYDNPGVDTDSDGYAGTFTYCCVESTLIAPSTFQCTLEDTVWIRGDELPDWRLYTPPCCVGRAGNINLVGIVDLSDLSALINFLTGGGYVPPCYEMANIDGSGIVDLSDLSALISYLSGYGYVPRPCP